jgi:hypothetical protein
MGIYSQSNGATVWRENSNFGRLDFLRQASSNHLNMNNFIFDISSTFSTCGGFGRCADGGKAGESGFFWPPSRRRAMVIASERAASAQRGDGR